MNEANLVFGILAGFAAIGLLGMFVLALLPKKEEQAIGGARELVWIPSPILLISAIILAIISYNLLAENIQLM